LVSTFQVNTKLSVTVQRAIRLTRQSQGHSYGQIPTKLVMCLTGAYSPPTTTSLYSVIFLKSVSPSFLILFTASLVDSHGARCYLYNFRSKSIFRTRLCPTSSKHGQVYSTVYGRMECVGRA